MKINFSNYNNRFQQLYQIFFLLIVIITPSYSANNYGFVKLKFIKCGPLANNFTVSYDNKYIYYNSDSPDIFRINNPIYGSSPNLIDMCHLKYQYGMLNFFLGSNNHSIYFSDDNGKISVIDKINLRNSHIQYVCQAGTSIWTDIANTKSVSLSPNGQDLAIVRHGDLYTYNLLSHKSRLISSFPGKELASPSWSPHGKNICYVVVSGLLSKRESWQIYQSNIQSHHYSHLTYTVGIHADEEPVYLDSSHIIFIRRFRILRSKAELIPKSGIDSRWKPIFETQLCELDTRSLHIRDLTSMTYDKKNLIVKQNYLYVQDENYISTYQIVR